MRRVATCVCLMIIVWILRAAAIDVTSVPGAGYLFVSSHDSHEVYRYDATNGVLVDRFVTSGSGGVSGPHGLAIGPDRHLYVASANTDEINRYDGTTGAFLNTFVTNGSGGMNYPAGIQFGLDGHLYVASQDNDRILRFHGLSGAFINVFVSAGSGGLNGPSVMAYGPDTNLYVTGRLDNRVYRYDGLSGAFLDVFVTNQLSQPFGCDFGPDGNLVVASGNDGQIDRFDGVTGTYLDTPIIAGLSFPVQLLFGPDDHLYVCSYGSDRVQRFDGTTGVFIDSLVTNGSGGLNGPNFLFFAPSGDGPLDRDGDGMPDWWEIVHADAGLLAGVSNPPTSDADFDGVTDRDEYISDTDPADSNSVWRLKAITVASPPMIVFDSSSNRLYTLQGAVGVTGLWENILGQVTVPGQGINDSLVDTNASGGERFYRVQVALPLP